MFPAENVLRYNAVCVSVYTTRYSVYVQSDSFVFTALHICRAVFPIAKVSVRLSVTCVNCDKTNESSAEILIPHER